MVKYVKTIEQPVYFDKSEHNSDHFGKVTFMHTKELLQSRSFQGVGRIRLHNHQKHVVGLVVYKEYIYVVRCFHCIIYSFTNKGLLRP